ncbi:hypothetical protein ABZ949_02660 [Micromonospora tulbaghiae]|uniref:hypothetical protein n=1 Tax=Micromonospora tulbaghiae TaxID=479978 RepID=UPI0033FEF18B
MSYEQPKPGRYRRLKDGAEVQVIGSTGSEWNDIVAVRSPRLSHFRLENFWKKYEPWPARVYVMHDTLTPHNVRGVWDDVLAVPAEGDTFTTQWGYMGATVDWTVARQEWLNDGAVTLYVTGPTGEPQP